MTDESERDCGPFAELWKCYLDSDWEHVRLEAEKLLGDQGLCEMLRGCYDASEKAEDRPCRKRDSGRGVCLTVDEAGGCRSWQTEVDGIWRVAFGGRPPAMERAVALFFAVHAAAYEYWEDSFDYDCIGCRLHLARQILERARQECCGGDASSPRRRFLEGLLWFNRDVHHGAFIENGMIANDPEAMAYHARRRIAAAEAGLEELLAAGGPEPWARPLAEAIAKHLEDLRSYHAALITAAELLALRQRVRGREGAGEFYDRYRSRRPELERCVAEREEEGDFEWGSEMRAHIACLERFAEHAGEAPLKLNDVAGTLSFGFYFNLADLPGGAAGGDSRGDPGPEGGAPSGVARIRNDPRLKQGVERRGLPVLVVSHDPAPDILKTSIGERHFENILILFEELRVRSLPLPGSGDRDEGRLLVRLVPKLAHSALGVGCVTFEVAPPDPDEHLDLTVSGYQILKNLACPHSARYAIGWAAGASAGDAARREGRIWTKLSDLARELALAYCNVVREMHGLAPVPGDIGSAEARQLPKPRPWIEPDQSWFTSFRIYRVEREGDPERRPLDAGELERHWEWPGLIAYHRADRASVDDWVGIDARALRLMNLGQVRAHRGDLFILSGNHALSYLPDDPEFVVLQYLETAKWTFLIRTLVACCLAWSDDELSALHRTLTQAGRAAEGDGSLGQAEGERRLSEAENEIHRANLRMQEFRMLALAAVDHVKSAGVSAYADHGLLLRLAFEATMLPDMVCTLQEKVRELNAGQAATGAVIQRNRDRRELERERVEQEARRAAEQRRRERDQAEQQARSAAEQRERERDKAEQQARFAAEQRERERDKAEQQARFATEQRQRQRDQAVDQREKAQANRLNLFLFALAAVQVLQVAPVCATVLPVPRVSEEWGQRIWAVVFLLAVAAIWPIVRARGRWKIPVKVLHNREDNRHPPGPGGHEGNRRLERILEAVPRRQSVRLGDAPPCGEDVLRLVHSDAYVRAVQALVAGLRGGQVKEFAEGTGVHPLVAAPESAGKEADAWVEEVTFGEGTYDAAVRSAGAAVAGVDAIFGPEAARRVFCAVRPPGHHAEPDKAMGYCIFSNAAIAAAHAADRYGKRVAVFDWDVHRANGTARGLASCRDKVLLVDFFILGAGENDYPYVPPTPEDLAGENPRLVALPPGTTGAAYRSLFEEVAWPRIRDWLPDLIVVSAGYDSLEGDPIGGFRLHPDDYFHLVRRLASLGTPILVLLEGGYVPEKLAEGVKKTIQAMGCEL
jgi:acetoin utilization deacetylase AcuC-like enzyme